MEVLITLTTRTTSKNKKMIIINPLIPLFLCVFFLSLSNPTQSQPSTIGYNCTNTNQTTTNSCQTYVVYRATPPDYLNLASISDLFSVSRPMISHPSNISSPNTTLLPNQLLFIPITCSCNTVNSSITISYAPLNYTIISGDTFYIVSTQRYQNLTTFQSVEVVNPSFEPTTLNVGDNIVFPIFCRCPVPSSSLNFLISYVFQPFDNISSIARTLGSTEQSIIDINGNNIQPFDTVFVPVSRLPNITQPAEPPPVVADTRRERTGVVVGLGVGLGICGVLLVMVCGVWYSRERSLRGKMGKYRDVEVMEKKGEGIKKSEKVNLMADVSGCLDKYKVYGIDELRDATDGFDDKLIIQGSVYKACIDGDWYAVKKMKWNAFEELKILQKVNHGNLVRLDGFSIDSEEANCYLVYEYIENGSLDLWLHEKKNMNEKLNWKTRLRIAVDVANGLQYIHEHTRPRVVHKDIKSSNILLDSNMRAKIANFGLAKSGCNAITMHIVGTQGYIAPEYLSDGVISTKMDVFSFGVVLLELVSGREVVDEEGKALWTSVSGLLEGTEERKLRKVREWMDECLMVNESCTMESVMSVMAVSLACLNKNPGKRPSMVEIVYALSKTDDLFFDVSDDGISSSQVMAR